MAKKKEETPPAGAPAWMATFSDLMNLLLCFFVLLFAMSNTDAEKARQIVASLNNSFSILPQSGSSVSEGELVSDGVAQLNMLDDYFTDMGMQVEEVEKQEVLDKIKAENEEFYGTMAEEIQGAAEEKKIDDYVEVSYNSKFVSLTMSGGILFDSGKADIKKEAMPIVSKLGDILKKYDDYMIEVTGHTDSIPISREFRNNLDLSANRAMTVQEYLQDVKHLTPKTLISSGRGEWDPIASNDTPEGRAKNRRVEIKIYRLD